MGNHTSDTKGIHAMDSDFTTLARLRGSVSGPSR